MKNNREKCKYYLNNSQNSPEESIQNVIGEDNFSSWKSTTDPLNKSAEGPNGPNVSSKKGIICTVERWRGSWTGP